MEIIPTRTGIYIEGAVFDPPEELKEMGLNPVKAFFTTGLVPSADLGGELNGITVSDFSVGKKGGSYRAFRISTPDGDVVYAPVFDRIEKAKLSGATVAILDAGDRGESTETTGLSHRSHTARERMVANVGVGKVIWSDELSGLDSIQIGEKREFDRNVGGGVDRDKLQDSDFVIVEGGERKFPIVTPQDVKDAVSSWGRYRGAVSFDEFKRRLTRIAKRKGEAFVNALPDEWKSEKKSMDDLLMDAVDEMMENDTDHPMWGVRHIGEGFVVFSIGQKKFRARYVVSDSSVTLDPPASWEEVTESISFTPVNKPEEPEYKSSLYVTKDDSGKLMWVSVSSSTFVDADGEVVSAKAMDFANEVAKKRGSFGKLVWEHYDELPVGECTTQMRVGNFLIESGSFHDTRFASRAAQVLKEAEPGKYRISIGFRYWQGTRSEDGVYSAIDIFHRAITDRPSNPITGIGVKEMKQLTDDEKTRISNDLGLTVADLDEVIKTVEQPVAQKSVDGEKVALKEETQEEKVDERDARLAALEKTIEELKSQLDKSRAATKEEVMKALNLSPKEEVVRASQTVPELTKEEATVVKEEVDKSDKASDEASKTGFSPDFYRFFNSRNAQ